MLVRHVIYKSLYKPILFVGCERLPFTCVITLGGLTLMLYQSLLVACGVFIFYLLAIGLIRKVNATDPQFFRCLYRLVMYHQDYYLAHAFYSSSKLVKFIET